MKLGKSQHILEIYDNIIKQQLKDCIIEIADSSAEYMENITLVTHYLPHHSVTSENGDNIKVRIVMEGCAKTHQSKKSFNDCLYRGPNKVGNLCGILMRFRLNVVAIIAGIEKAYLQLQLKKDDRDVTRFLWVKDMREPFSNNNIVQFRFCRVIWGMVSAAFLLAMTILYHLKKYDNEVSKNMSDNMYVDNLIISVASEKKAISFYHQTKSIFSNASMNMCKWNCSSKKVMNKITDGDECDEEITKLLGMIWFREIDLFGLGKIADLPSDQVTKRLVLKTISSIFDPCGNFSPVLIRAKSFLQELWRKKISWDGVT